WTARVKRLFATQAVLLAIPAAGMIIFPKGNIGFIICSVVFVLLCALDPVLVLLARTVNVPMERSINKWYLNDARRVLNESGAKVIGVTGSFGKTGTKFILGRMLSEKFNTVVTPESFNTTMGVVRTIREKVTPATQIFVAEMGAKNVGDIKEICDLVAPDAGIITAVGPQHLETFKTLENVQKTKFELADAVARKGGEMVLNFESAPVADYAANYENVVSYGLGENSDVKISDVVSSRDGSEFAIEIEGKRISLCTKLLGMHNVLNITGAAIMAYRLGVEPEKIAFAVRRLQPVEHRLELKGFVNGSLMLDDAYNSNPVGCLEAVNVLASFDGMKKIIVTPGLVELGDIEYESNYNLAAKAADCCDIMIFVGRERAVPMLKAAEDKGYNMDNAIVVETFAQAVDVLREKADSNSVILVENDLPDVYK
ncbi:MAG: UDP-N-acetylmuramoyl-tripeptide--D-alanyl-D-alanine ligase, partial [Clostridia bacterium]|nr:UDP-N-acetylmuramoyl-tripeptide--D-alanyl-D-alanine ligase [Clostridia bacterium]